LVPAVSVANELAAQPSYTWKAFALAVEAPSTFPSSTCIDLLWVIHVHYIVQQQHVLLAHSSVLSIGSSKSFTCSAAAADLFHQDQTYQNCHFHYHAKHSESCHDRTTVVLRCFIVLFVIYSLK